MRIVLALLALAVLSACAGGEQGPLPAEQAQAVAFVDDGPAKITLITVINNRSGSGGHTGLLVSGSQRVLFDPAGSFRPDWVAEYGDVLYGISDQKYAAYKSAHSRNSYHVVTQEVLVNPATAEKALQLVQAQGSVASALCANSTSNILRQLPEFQNTKVTFFPRKLMEQFAEISGVVTDRYYENDDGDVLDGITDLAPLE